VLKSSNTMERTDKILTIILVFLLGMITMYGIQYMHISEKPLGITLVGATTAPLGSIDKNSIIFDNEKVIINVKGASLGKYADTGSMKPTLDENTKGIRIPITDKETVKIGDIITYENELGEYIIHRVVSIGLDEEGVYYLLKGDNNFIIDAKVYYEQLRYKLVGVIW